MQTPILQSEKRGQSTTAQDPLNENWVVRVGGGSETLFVDEVAYPQQVGVGEPIDIRVQVVNAAITVGPFDDDQCNVGAGQSGYSYTATVEVEGAGTKTQQKCLQAGFEEDHEFDFTAPQQPGTYTMDITVEGTGSGFSGGGTREIEVVPEEQQDGDRNRDDDRKQEGGNDGKAGDDDGDGLPDLGNLIGTTDALVIGGGLVLFLVVLISLQQ
jgi:hypothetical protein